MIQVRGLTKRYGDVLAVDDLSFDVEPGKVTGFLGGQNPKKVPMPEMNRVRGQEPTAQETPVVEKIVPNITYNVGQQVRVRSGAFANFTGEVEEINADKQKIWLSVSLFGRPTRVEVDFSEVEPVA